MTGGWQGTAPLAGWPVAGTDLPRSPEGAPRRHVHVVPSLNLGGAERIALDLARAIGSVGGVVDLVVMREAAHAHASERRPGVVVHRLGRLPWPERTEQAAALIAATGLPAYCHLTSRAELEALWAAGAATVPVVHNVEAGWTQDPRTWDAGRVPFVMACGSAVAADVAASGTPHPVRFMRHVAPPPPAMDAGRRRAVRRALGAGDATLLIGMVGRVVAQKRHDRVPGIVEALVAAGTDARVAVLGAIGGDGVAIAASVKAEAARLGVARRIAFVGAVAGASALMAAFDVLLTTSDWEGVSVATMEALAAGVPAVSGDVGGQAEILPPSALVPADAAPSAWAEAVLAAAASRPPPPGKGMTEAAAALWPAMLRHPPSRGVAATPRRTLLVTGNMDAGGAQRGLGNLLAALAARGVPRNRFELAVFGPVGVPDLLGPALAAGVRVRDASGVPGRRHGPAGRVGRLLALVEEGFDQVAFWNMDAATKLAVAKVLADGPTRLVDVSPGPALVAELDLEAATAAGLSTTPDAYLAGLDLFVAKYRGGAVPEGRGRPRRTAVIPNGVPVPAGGLPAHEGPRPPRGVDPARCVLVVGRIVEAKMPALMPAVARRLGELSPGASLVMVGGAHGAREQAAHAGMMARCGGVLPDNMSLLPPDARTLGWMGRFGALLMLSRGQGCPNTSLEAMASGLPVVANDDGGTAEQLCGGCGILLASEAEDDLVEEAARALAALFGDPGRRAAIVAAAAARIAVDFPMAAMAEGYAHALGLGDDGGTDTDLPLRGPGPRTGRCDTWEH